MANDSYLSYEQVLQELQINRSELNRLIRDGRLKDHVISGETKFRRLEVVDLKKSLQKRPTVMAEEGTGSEPTTDVLLAAAGAGAKGKEPETQILEGEAADEEPAGKHPAAPQERDTEVLDEKGEPALDLEMPADEELELERPLAEATPLSDSALETDLELKSVKAKPAAEEEDFFDFTEALKGEDFELEGAEAADKAAPKGAAPKAAVPTAGAPKAAAAPAPKAAAPKAAAAPASKAAPAAPKAAAPKAAAPKAGAPKAGADEAVGDVMALDEEAAGGEVSEEELLSEIMDIEGAEEPEEETADITADITTMEEPTYEATGLEDVLAGGAEEEAAEEFEIPQAAPIGAEVQVGGLWVLLLAVALVALILAGLFVVDNGSNPGYTSGLTSWAMKLSGR